MTLKTTRSNLSGQIPHQITAGETTIHHKGDNSTQTNMTAQECISWMTMNIDHHLNYVPG